MSAEKMMPTIREAASLFPRTAETTSGSRNLVEAAIRFVPPLGYAKFQFETRLPD
jgi:hypothetical protein